MNPSSESADKKPVLKTKDFIFIETMGYAENDLEFDEGVIAS